MKKLFLIAIAVVALSNATHAQVEIVETFDSNTLGWNEFAWKKGQGIIKNGYLELFGLEQDKLAYICADLPISPEHDFKLTSKIIVPKLSDDYPFGIMFDTDEELNFCAVLIKEASCRFIIYNEDKEISSREIPIKLQSKKNQEVVLEMEKRGRKLIFSVNNMEIPFKWTRELKSSTFGFCAQRQMIKVDELKIEQDYSGE